MLDFALAESVNAVFNVVNRASLSIHFMMVMMMNDEERPLTLMLPTS